MERTHELTVRLTESHVVWLRDAAENSRMELGEYFQRLLQHHVDEAFELPHPECRAMGKLSADILHASNRLGEATRALEQGDARNHALQSEIASAVVEFRDVIREVGHTLDGLRAAG